MFKKIIVLTVLLGLILTLQDADAETSVLASEGTYLSLINGAQPVPNSFGLNPKNPSAEWTYWGKPIDDRTNIGWGGEVPNELVIGGVAFERGISGVPFGDNRAIFRYDLTGGNYTEFQGYIGTSDMHDHRISPDNETGCGKGGSVIFIFRIDQKQVYKSKVLTGSDDPVKVTFDIPANAKTLHILIDNAGDEPVGWCDHAVIGDAKLLGTFPDVNGDGSVDIVDLISIAVNFGSTFHRYDVNRDGIVDKTDLILVADLLTSAAAAPMLEPTPLETALFPNYPNPFNPETWIPYQLAKPTDVTVRIYAANGALVRTLALGYQQAGVYQTRSRAAYWDGRNAWGELVSSGVYFYTLTAGDFIATRKLLIRK